MILYFLWILFLYHSKLISEGFCMNKGARPGTSCHPIVFMLLWYLMMYYYKLYCSIFSLHKGKITKPKLSLQSVLLISSPFPLSYSEYFQIQSTLKYINVFFRWNLPTEDCKTANNRLSVFSLSHVYALPSL